MHQETAVCLHGTVVSVDAFAIGNVKMAPSPGHRWVFAFLNVRMTCEKGNCFYVMKHIPGNRGIDAVCVCVLATVAFPLCNH